MPYLFFLFSLLHLVSFTTPTRYEPNYTLNKIVLAKNDSKKLLTHSITAEKSHGSRLLCATQSIHQMFSFWTITSGHSRKNTKNPFVFLFSTQRTYFGDRISIFEETALPSPNRFILLSFSFNFFFFFFVFAVLLLQILPIAKDLHSLNQFILWLGLFYIFHWNSQYRTWLVFGKKKILLFFKTWHNLMLRKRRKKICLFCISGLFFWHLWTYFLS